MEPFPPVATKGLGDSELVNGVPVADALVLVRLLVTLFVAVTTTLYSVSSTNENIESHVKVGEEIGNIKKQKHNP